MPDDETLAGLEPDAPDAADDAASEDEAEPQAETVDPRDARIAALEASLKALEPEIRDARGVKAAVGRIQSLEASLKKMADCVSFADLDPRVSANEDLTVTLAQSLANSALVDDTDKAALSAALQNVERSRTATERKSMLRELKAELNTTEVQPQTSNPQEELWRGLSDEIAAAAEEYGVARTAIPFAQIQADAAFDPTKVVRVALKWLEAQKAPDNTTRVAERRRAAGAGSPVREGALGPVITDMSDADAAYAAGLITHAAYRAHREKFELGVMPGGGR